MTTTALIDRQKAFFRTGATKAVTFRLEALKTLKTGITVFETEILEALQEDLGKSAHETFITELGIVLSEIAYFERHLRRWIRPQKKPSGLLLFPSRSYLYPEPYGVALIMSPWNYPFQLAMMPLVAAIAAGNTCVVKPASYAPATSKVLEQLLSHCFDPEYVATILGGRAQNTELLDQHFDFIFFTGSTEVGRHVMQKAAANLTPVALELGGKSPCIVLPDADIPLAAKRIAFGKIINAGQTCIAPDYVLVHDEVRDELLREMQKAITTFLGPLPETNPDYPKIINEKHFTRLQGYLADGKIVYGGAGHRGRIAPTLLTDVAVDAKVMQEEIFGPILPILGFSDLESALAIVEERAKPLALYIFTNDKKAMDKIIHRLSCGGVTINDTLMHYMSRSLGFGGVGESGLGRYHGKPGFDTFSNHKAVVRRYRILDLDMRYHPYSDKKSRAARKLIK